MGRTSEKGIDFIKSWEKLRLKMYDDGYGYLTVGYGHVVRKGEDLKEITEDQAREILKKDLLIAEDAVNKLIKVKLNQNQYDALVSFTFNAGSGNLQRSTLRMKINRGELNVREYFMRYVKSSGKVSRGLERRRKAESDIFLLNMYKGN